MNTKISEATRFMKRPVIIEAMQFDGSATSASSICQWANAGDEAAGHDDPTVSYIMRDGDDDAHDMVIWTLEGDMTASAGDWIIKGVKGEFYPCKPDIFEMTYTPHLHPQPAELAEQQGDAHSLAALAAQVGAFEYGDPEARYYDFTAEQLVQFAALAATGKQQVGEVQKGARTPAEIAAVLRAMTINYAHGHVWDHLDAEVCREAADVLASRQPGAQVPFVWSDRAKADALEAGQFGFTEADGQDLGYTACVEACVDSICAVLALPEHRAAPPAPAQGIDLGQFREAVIAAREHHEQTWADMHDTGHAKLAEYDRLLALIDRQRDAAPGVGNG